MQNDSTTYQIAIVGGGAVGLFLGICLEKAGISCIILEKRTLVREGSRSLGIHPVSLELFNQLDITTPFLDHGIQIQKGHAFANTSQIGTLSFADCPPPFNFILALPQNRTESLLEKELHKLNPNALVRGAEVTGIEQTDQQVTVSYQKNEIPHNISAEFVIGCDGKHSFVRQQAGIAFEGKSYADTYIMGDFSDNTTFGSNAAIFLCDQGLIESFPLHNNMRRWVVKTADYISPVDRQQIEERLWKRIELDITDTKNVMLSSFGVQKLMANPMIRNRIILAGDAAHVVSPIGGQGMNLGWLGAWDLTQSLKDIVNQTRSHHQILNEFEQRRFKAARNAMRRAEMNMRLGRSTKFPAIRNALVSLMLKKPISQLMAQLFTMRGIERWIV
jgi:2-polyprenyl-6-methoxyphenol hydroxylase-like FAD-dependent oxidoreductase